MGKPKGDADWRRREDRRSRSRPRLKFFLLGLREVSAPDVDRDELLYNASVLAHFAQSSTQSTDDLPTPAHLGAGFYRRAAAAESQARKARLLRAMGSHFESWRQRHAQLGRELRDRPYLLGPPPIM